MAGRLDVISHDFKKKKDNKHYINAKYNISLSNIPKSLLGEWDEYTPESHVNKYV